MVGLGAAGALTAALGVQVLPRSAAGPRLRLVGSGEAPEPSVGLVPGLLLWVPPRVSSLAVARGAGGGPDQAAAVPGTPR